MEKLRKIVQNQYIIVHSCTFTHLFDIIKLPMQISETEISLSLANAAERRRRRPLSSRRRR